MGRKLESIEISARRAVKICERVRALDKSQSWEDCAFLLGISPGTLTTLRKNAQLVARPNHPARRGR